jgi:hypothetical protein
VCVIHDLGALRVCVCERERGGGSRPVSAQRLVSLAGERALA